jgi:ADP-heptose:LPS heptosyltransferase
MNSVPPPAPGKYAGYWKIKQFRRGLRNALSARLARGNALPEVFQPLEPSSVQRVLVCRLNKRLGNMLFLTPLLRSIALTLPQAEIDVLVRDPAHAELFRTLPGVKNIWCLPRFGWRLPFSLPQFLWRLRRRKYDLAVEPSTNSFSNRLLVKFSGARWRLGFFAAGQWLRLTHAVMPDPAQRHEVLIPLHLVSAGFREGTARLHPRMDLALTADEVVAGREKLERALGAQGTEPVIGFFTEATGKKRLPPEWWRGWLAGLRQSGKNFRLLQILPPGDAPPLEAGMPHLREPAHRKLAAVLGELDLFVSCDAGPMHLASAAGAPVIGLFVSAKKHRYGPLGERSLALQVNDLTPAQAADAVLMHLDRLRH